MLRPQLIFEKRVSRAWIGAMPENRYFNRGLSFNEAFQWCLNEFHSWPALIVGCHLDETTPLAEFFIVEGGQHAEYRLREVSDV